MNSRIDSRKNRSEINTALDKALAFKAAGNDSTAAYWAGVLMQRLEWAGITPEKVAE